MTLSDDRMSLEGLAVAECGFQLQVIHCLSVLIHSNYISAYSKFVIFAATEIIVE